MRFFGFFIFSTFIKSERTECHDRDGRFVWWLENCPGVGISNDTGLRLRYYFLVHESLDRDRRPFDGPLTVLWRFRDYLEHHKGAKKSIIFNSVHSKFWIRR